MPKPRLPTKRIVKEFLEGKKLSLIEMDLVHKYRRKDEGLYYFVMRVESVIRRALVRARKKGRGSEA